MRVELGKRLLSGLIVVLWDIGNRREIGHREAWGGFSIMARSESLMTNPSI